jgi:phospholipase/lecithinase/hemolysin
VDFLGEALGLEVSTDSDFAWGGATTNNRLVPGFSTFLNSTVPSFQEQVRAYLSQSSAASPCESEGDNRNDVAATTALYVVLIGYNDYWWYANQNVTDSTTNSDMEAFVDRVVSSLIEGVQDLVSGRCRGRRAVAAVGNLPPMDLLPDASSKAPPVVGAYRELTRLHNAKLADELGGLDRKAAGGARIRLFPVHEALSELVDHASCLGFGNASLACLNSKAEVCDDPYRHLFWDEWHPMTWTHQKLAGAALAAAAP